MYDVQHALVVLRESITNCIWIRRPDRVVSVFNHARVTVSNSQEPFQLKSIPVLDESAKRGSVSRLSWCLEANADMSSLPWQCLSSFLNLLSVFTRTNRTAQCTANVRQILSDETTVQKLIRVGLESVCFQGSSRSIASVASSTCQGMALECDV